MSKKKSDRLLYIPIIAEIPTVLKTIESGAKPRSGGAVAVRESEWGVVSRQTRRKRPHFQRARKQKFCCESAGESTPEILRGEFWGGDEYSVLIFWGVDIDNGGLCSVN